MRLSNRPDFAVVRVGKNRIHSVLTALPVIMLVVGLYVHYSGENAQISGQAITSESTTLEGIFNGLSRVKGSGSGKHFIWIETAARARGLRLTQQQSQRLQSLQKGSSISILAAPTVSGSTTLWVYQLEQDGNVIIDAPVMTPQ